MNREIWLWLLLVMGAHNERTMQIVESCGDVLTAAKSIRDGSCQLLTDEEKQRAARIRRSNVNNVIRQCNDNRITILTIEDDEYPELLRNIPCPPVVLFVQGDTAALNSRVSLAVVGTRHPSSYAVGAAQRICRELAALDITIVSGLAEGIDSTAHKAALDKGARTVGVLACGSLVGYPAATLALRNDILRRGGAIVSELLPNATVDQKYFRHRNRIISGLAYGTFIVEASEISGCRLTAAHTIQQNRELFCLPPHDVFNRHYSGVAKYLRDGATPVFGSVDIINSLKYRIFGDA